MVKLDLGCYNHKKKGYIGLDIVNYSHLYPKGEFIQHDLNKPLPFKNNSIDEIYIELMLSYCPKDFYSFGDEIYRVLKPNGIVEVIVVHFSSSSAFSSANQRFFRYNFVFPHPTHFNFGADRFEAIERRLIFQKRGFHIFGTFFEYLFNKIPITYENTFLRNLFPAWKLYIKLKANKKKK